MPYRVPAGPRAARRLLVGGLTLAATLGLAGPAQAGRLVVTGHDAEAHCAQEGASTGSCRFVSVGVNYVRGGAPDAGKPVLVLDRGKNEFATALNYIARTGNAVPYRVVDPRSAEFASLPLTTSNYSAILVASSKDDANDPTPADLNELDSTPDTDAINARARDIAAFFDAGGGLFVNSGGAAARANSARYYRFINITRGGGQVTAPLFLTDLGRSIGWQDARMNPAESNDINCCLTHVSFQPPAPESPLKIAERDKAGRAVTLVADTNRLASIEEPPAKPTDVFAGLPGGSTGTPTTSPGGGQAGSPRAVCVPRRALRISLRRPRGVRFTKVVAYVNGKRVKTVTRKRLGSGRKTRPFTVRLSQTRRSKIRIVATTASNRKYTYRQTYKPCR